MGKRKPGDLPGGFKQRRAKLLLEEEAATFGDLTDYCREQLEEKSVKAYQTVLENEDVLRRNYHMMQLYTPIMSINAKNLVHETLDNPDMSFNKTELTKLMLQDGFGETNFVDLFTHCKKITVDSK